MKYYVKKRRLEYKEDQPEVWKIQKLGAATINEKELIKYVSNTSQLPPSVIKAALLAISEAITYFVINGHYVTFDDFGSFFLKIATKVVRNREEVSVSQVQRTTLGFKASSILTDIIHQTGMEKADSVSVKLLKTDSEDERI